MRAPVRILVSLGLLVGALLVFQLRSTGEAVPVRKSFNAFPMVVGEWRGTQATVLEVEILNVLKVSDYVMRRYSDPAGGASGSTSATGRPSERARKFTHPRIACPGVAGSRSRLRGSAFGSRWRPPPSR